jgi:UDP-N-acetylmuramoyl-L-alanyl-D-glutamate--2,6-diaminopimelate ligase
VRLSELLTLLTIHQTHSYRDTEISGIKMSSRHVTRGDLFVCIPGIPGFQEDRHNFIEAAERAGAAALVVERDVNTSLPTIKVPDARYALAVLAAHYHGYPSNALKLIGVTGTNGKTTTCHMIDRILSHSGRKTGLMGNIGTRIDNVMLETDINTQEPHVLQSNLRKMKELAHEYCVMEVSSQGLHMGRVMGCDFRTAVFTNLTQDHLDYHHNMESYLQAKSLLFSRLGNAFSPEFSKRKFAILNSDDPASNTLRRSTAAQVITYGIESRADVTARDIRLSPRGVSFVLVSFAGNAEISLNMIGTFNVYNALAAITAALVEEVPLNIIEKAMPTLNHVPGRMEHIDEGQDFTVIVDYAHSPDGLEKALSTVRQLTHGKLITVFGCGGNRDRSKRPLMGAISAKYSDITIITSDDPRSEDPESILCDVEQGAALKGHHYELIVDRGEAILRAIELASAGDLVIVAGKGHEEYQVLAEGAVRFSDRQVLRAAIRQRLTRSSS